MFWVVLYFSDGSMCRYRQFSTRHYAKLVGCELMVHDKNIVNFKVRKVRSSEPVIDNRQYSLPDLSDASPISVADLRAALSVSPL